MNQQRLLLQMVAFQKSAFDSAFDAVRSVQDQGMAAMEMLSGQAGWPHAEGRRVIGDWIRACRQGCEDFREITDLNYAKLRESLHTGMDRDG